MITAMTVLTVILAVVALAALVRGAAYLYDFVSNDGFGHLTVHSTPPRSHPRDFFDTGTSSPNRLNTALYPR